MYIVQDIPQCTLKDKIENGHMNLEQALLTMQQIIDGLIALHSKEIAFLNLDTDNIMITDV